MALLRRAQEALECSNKLNDELSYELKAEEAEAELDRQLNYVQKVEEIAEAVEAYRQSRGIDASSVVSQLEDDNDDHSVDSTDTAIHDSAITDADMYGASRGNVPNYEREETAHRLGQLQVRDMRMADTPDQWTDEYVTGRAIPNVCYDDSCRRSTVRAELDSYDGTASQWFAWIDLFKALVHDTAMSPGEKLAILRNSLKGDCRDLVYALGGGEDAYKEALRSLKARCGRRDVIRAAHLQALYKLDPGRTPSQMVRFTERVRTHLFDLSRTGETANTDIVDCLVAKLSIQDRLAWHEMCQRDSGPLSLPKFGHWLCSRAAAYQNAYELAAEQSSNITKEVPGKISRNQARSHTMTSQKDRDKWTCHCCTGSHSSRACMDFKKLKVSQRWQLVKKKKICFSCLQGQHRSTECQYSKLCGVNGCQSAHHPLLHRQHGPQQERNASVNSACSKPGQVTVYVIDSNGSKIPVNLFFDEGSDKTFVRERLLNKLQLHDAPTGRSLMTRGFGGVKRWFNSFLVKLTIERLDGRARFDILANTAPVLCDPAPTICWPKIKHRWKHLADLPLAESKGRIDILLGLDRADLMSATESRQGDKDEPIAMNTTPRLAEQSSNITKEVPGKISRNQARSHTMTSQKDRDKWTCHCCTGSHSSRACMDFKKLKVSQRWQLVKKKKICFSCLQGQHRSTECQYSKLCGVNGCQSAHHPLLHREQGPQQERNASVNSACSKPGQVTVYVIDSNGSKIPVNLFFDEGSDKTFVRERLLNKLQLHDAPTGRSLMTRGFGGVKRWFNSFLVKLTIERLDGRARFDILANTAPVLCDPAPTICWPKIKHRWKHLADLPLAESKGRIDILLGLDRADLMSATESRQGDKDEPIAMNTTPRLDEDLAHQFRQFCETEAFGTEGKSRQKLAPEDERAKQIVESGSRKLEVGFEVPLPWRTGEPNIPNNRPLAEFRLRSLLLRFEKDPVYKADYKKAINNYLSSGYAHEVTDENELNVREQYFLPHHGVRKKSSSTQKLRIVFDSSAPYNGRSLNSALLTGPILQNELPMVLMKFSEGEVAFAADIEAMFSWIRLRPEDARYHRFLWKEDKTERTKVFQMNRVTFGDTCSPFLAISTIMLTAREFGQGKEEAVRAIKNSLYVDDYHDSAGTISEAIVRAREVRDILRKGDFHLTKWISNRAEVMEAFNEKPASPSSVEPYRLGEDTYDTKVLGVRWRPLDDVLVFHVDLGG
ncbi:hypothetical protein M514_27252 [Trichuris suis]|uniref:Peptidase aspartic putative domain-containing protein n=2 Tax=Trichuris suis TaxID=68888 RepID=A0A085MTK2_9BILA|nr:hypothetical protein M514_27252 [Trichuris suis]